MNQEPVSSYCNFWWDDDAGKNRFWKNGKLSFKKRFQYQIFGCRKIFSSDEVLRQNVYKKRLLNLLATLRCYRWILLSREEVFFKKRNVEILWGKLFLRKHLPIQEFSSNVTSTVNAFPIDTWPPNLPIFEAALAKKTNLKLNRGLRRKLKGRAKIWLSKTFLNSQ